MAGALECFDRAIALNPDFAEAHNNRGVILHARGRDVEALAAFDRVTALKPAFAEGHNNRGGALEALGRHDEALAAHERAIAFNPNYAVAHYNRGVALQSLGRYEEALNAFDRAAFIKPDYASAYNNLGSTLQVLGRYEEALAAHDRAIALNAANPEAWWNKSLLLLLTGRYEEGWRLYEWRWRLKEYLPLARQFAQPLWSGSEDIAGRTLLLHHEQGLGDTIQMLRYVPLLAAKGARILLEVPATLSALAGVLPGVAGVLQTGDVLPAFDLHCPFMSLPPAFKTGLETIPASMPYLKAPEGRVHLWKDRMGAKTRPRIGLVWSGGKTHKLDRLRSIPLATLLPLLERDAEFHSLQVEYRESDREILAKDGRLSDHSGEIKDFADTAALIEAMDLVIAVDTATAHLAGALGKPVWILLPYAPDFRWLRQREDSPWYPTARLFRQPAVNAWEPVIARLKAELLIQAQKPSPPAGEDPALLQKKLFQQALNLHRSGAFAEALTAYDRVIAVHPENHVAHYNRGNVLRALGRPEEALCAWDHAVALQPEFVQAHANRGLVLYEQGKLEEAVAACNRAIAINENFAPAYATRGIASGRLERYGEALADFNRALSLQPDDASAYLNRGNVLGRLKRYEEALTDFDRVIAIQPSHAEAFFNRGNVLVNLERYVEALSAFDRALDVHPGYAEAYNNRGNTLVKLERYGEALADFDRAIALRPNLDGAHYNRGFILHGSKRYGEALSAYNRAIEINPDSAVSHWNKSLLLLLTGRYEEGWRLYEWRHKVLNLNTRSFVQPLWLGDADVAGKTILLYQEQGYGDTLQMLRYIAPLAERGARILMDVPDALLPLVREMSGVAGIVQKDGLLPDFDLCCPFMSLPLAFRTTVETIPASVPYLKAPQHKLDVWRARLGQKGCPRVGLVWSGQSQYKIDVNRSIALSVILPLLERDAEFHSLQIEYRKADRPVLAAHLDRLRDHAGEIADFGDTAALIEEMDLVITVDTSTAHLAGALGKPVWILLPEIPDFRWMTDRPDSPWYPTARLFRRSVLDEWETIVEAMKIAVWPF